MKGTFTWVRGKFVTPLETVGDQFRFGFMEREQRKTNAGDPDWSLPQAAEFLSRQMRGEILVVSEGIFSSTRANVKRDLILFALEGPTVAIKASDMKIICNSLEQACETACDYNKDLLLDPLEQLADIPEEP